VIKYNFVELKDLETVAKDSICGKSCKVHPDFFSRANSHRRDWGGEGSSRARGNNVQVDAKDGMSFNA
jgi:hypothetical protein